VLGARGHGVAGEREMNVMRRERVAGMERCDIWKTLVDAVLEMEGLGAIVLCFLVV
jgi:hypothetical protein